MCGLAGWFGLDLEDKAQQEELLRLLLRKAQVRGVDSFGVAFNRKARMRIHRGLGPVSRWLNRDRTRVARVARASVVVGHTRAASRGEVSLVNAHPFRVGAWCGAHNGTLSNSASLMLGARYAPRGETDSEESLTWLVSEELTADAFRQLQGAFAMTIVKEDAAELVIAVDARTPFALARVEGGIVWHSLAIALESSLSAVGLTVQVEEVKNQILRFPRGAADELWAPTAAVPELRHAEAYDDRVMRASEARQMELEEVFDE